MSRSGRICAFCENVPEYSQERAAAQLELMGISMSREIISQMESGHHNIRISVLLAFKQVYEVDSFDDFFVQQEKGGDR